MVSAPSGRYGGEAGDESCTGELAPRRLNADSAVRISKICSRRVSRKRRENNGLLVALRNDDHIYLEAMTTGSIS